MINELIKLQTKLRHVNIHLHWLRQKVQYKTINICWISTKEIIADSLTKALLSIKHAAFVEITEIKDQKKCLASLKKKNNLKATF